MTRNQGNEWFIARVPTDYDADYRVIFEGIVGNGFMGDVVSVFFIKFLVLNYLFKFKRSSQGY